MVTGVWLSESRYLVADPITGRSETVTILMLPEEYTDPVYVSEMEYCAKEDVIDGWKKKDKENARPFTPEERRGLGGVLKDVRAFKKKKRETSKGRVFPVS